MRKLMLSGVDSSVDVKDLERLCRRYDFLEFGVSVDAESTGVVRRFPSFEFIDSMISLRLPITCQLHGILADSFLKTGREDSLVEFLGEERLCSFNHIQLSTADIGGVSTFVVPDHMKLILQCSDEEGRLFYMDMARNSKNAGRIYMLSDKPKKLGATTKEDFYPNAGDGRGYKGGFNENNIAYMMGYLDGITHNSDYWIDIEGEDLFDIEKAWRICHEVDKW